MEVKQYNNSNQGETIQGETIWNVCHPGDDVGVLVLVHEKRRWKEDTGGGDELAAKNTGKVQKRQDTKRGYQKGAGTTGHIGRQIRKKKADVVRARNKDGGK